jgi:hypothetical protein
LARRELADKLATTEFSLTRFKLGLTPSHLIRTSAAVLAAAIAGPLETGARLDFGERLLFWAVVLGVGGVLFFLLWRAVSALCERFDCAAKTKAVVAPVTAALLFALPLLPVVTWIAQATMGDLPVDPLSVWLSATAFALLVWLVQFVLHLLPQRGTQLASTPLAESTPQLVLRSQLGSVSDVACVEAQDHYLRVTDMSGASRLVLYRFADAVAELGDAGEQVHRSFWVAARAVVSAERRGKRLQVALATGQRVPVSERFLHAVRARGWADLPAQMQSDKLGAYLAAQRTSAP